MATEGPYQKRRLAPWLTLGGLVLLTLYLYARAHGPLRTIGLGDGPNDVSLLRAVDEPVIVQGDGQRLHQILANLLANARVHTVPGTTVLTSITREPGRVRLSVHDDGPGVPAELQKSVFQRFARGDSSRNRAAGSTGLGLSIVAAVAGAHGGTVELTSKPSDTTFSVVLPDLAGPASVPAPTTAHRATP